MGNNATQFPVFLLLKMEYFPPRFRSIDFCAVWGENISFFTFFSFLFFFPKFPLFFFSLLPPPAKTPLYLQERGEGEEGDGRHRGEEKEEREGKQFPFTGENKLLRKCGKGKEKNSLLIFSHKYHQKKQKISFFVYASLSPEASGKKSEKT